MSVGGSSFAEATLMFHAISLIIFLKQHTPRCLVPSTKDGLCLEVLSTFLIILLHVSESEVAFGCWTTCHFLAKAKSSALM